MKVTKILSLAKLFNLYLSLIAAGSVLIFAGIGFELNGIVIPYCIYPILISLILYPLNDEIGIKYFGMKYLAVKYLTVCLILCTLVIELIISEPVMIANYEGFMIFKGLKL